MPITVILAASQLQSLSKDRLFYCQTSTVQPFPSPSNLNHMDLKIPAQGRGGQKKAGNRACCALAVTALLASSVPVSQQNETIKAVPQTLLCWVGRNPGMAGTCSWLSGRAVGGIVGCQEAPLLGQPTIAWAAGQPSCPVSGTRTWLACYRTAPVPVLVWIMIFSGWHLQRCLHFALLHLSSVFF